MTSKEKRKQETKQATFATKLIKVRGMQESWEAAVETSTHLDIGCLYNTLVNIKQVVAVKDHWHGRIVRHFVKQLFLLFFSV